MIDFSIYPAALHHSFHFYSKNAHASSTSFSQDELGQELNTVAKELFGFSECHYYLVRSEMIWDFVINNQWEVFREYIWTTGKSNLNVPDQSNVIEDYSFSFPFHEIKPDRVGLYKLNSSMGLPVGYSLLIIPIGVDLVIRSQVEPLIGHCSKEELYLAAKVLTDINYRGLENLKIEANYKHHLLESIRLNSSFIEKDEREGILKTIKNYMLLPKNGLVSGLLQKGIKVQENGGYMLIANYPTISKEQTELLVDAIGEIQQEQ